MVSQTESPRRPGSPPRVDPSIERAVAAYAPITLAEMEEVKLMNRVDTKYVMRESRFAELLDSLVDDYRVLEVAGTRLTPYSSLYFDTHQRRCYLDHHNGKANRRKFRMRRYDSSGAAFFEVKLKDNKGRTDKRRMPIPSIRRSVDGESAVFAEQSVGRRMDLDPQMWTCFSRLTLVGRGFVERATLDVGLEFFNMRDRREALSGVVVIEVKQPRFNRHTPLRRRLREMRVYPMRMSKYCIGSALLDPSLKRNRFKAKLLAIQAL